MFFQALFLWVVSVINTSLGKGEDSLPFIGVLDIFGAISPLPGTSDLCSHDSSSSVLVLFW